MGRRPKKPIKKESFIKKHWFNIFSSLIAAVALVISIFSYNQNEEIARKSGAFDKGNLEFLFGNYFIIPQKNYEVYYGLRKTNKVNFVKFPTGIINSGNKTIEDVRIYYQYPNHLHMATSDSIMMVETNFKENAKRRYLKDSRHESVSLNIGEFNPLEFMGVGDILALDKIRLKNNTLYVEHNKNTVYPFDVSVTGKDIETKGYSFTMKIKNQTNIDLLIKEIVKDKLDKRKRNHRINMSFFVTTPSIFIDSKFMRTFESKDSEIAFIQFDTNFEYYIIFNSDNSIRKIEKIN